MDKLKTGGDSGPIVRLCRLVSRSSVLQLPSYRHLWVRMQDEVAAGVDRRDFSRRPYRVDNKSSIINHLAALMGLDENRRLAFRGLLGIDQTYDAYGTSLELVDELALLINEDNERLLLQIQTRETCPICETHGDAMLFLEIVDNMGADRIEQFGRFKIAALACRTSTSPVTRSSSPSRRSIWVDKRLKQIKGNNLRLGGLSAILSGDFWQLMPVKAPMIPRTNMAAESTIMRQQDAEFLAAIEGLRTQNFRPEHVHADSREGRPARQADLRACVVASWKTASELDPDVRLINIRKSWHDHTFDTRIQDYCKEDLHVTVSWKFTLQINNTHKTAHSFMNW
ncbi:uncharacterized protein BKA78DRAFT_344922 [Phyllosticta capitalensis]|uniref:uncharacterized protein n=1 Tax=Phyllosticta capitalensis TaxID=121624 RepID=UPI0031311A19